MSKKPNFIDEDATIGIVAPSCGCANDPYLTRLDASIARFKNKGYRVVEGINTRRNDALGASAPAKERAEEFMSAYLDDNIDVVMSAGGGEFMNEILPHIDFEKLKQAKPKWFMGFSDNANLTFTLTTIADVMSIYGPNVPSFFEKPWRLNQKDSMALLRGETSHVEGYKKWSYGTKRGETNLLARIRYAKHKHLVPFNYESPFEGTILGGCLDCVHLLCGTRWDKVKEYCAKQEGGVIWYFEACDYNPCAIRRALFVMKEAGWFINAKGFLFGRPLCQSMTIMGVDKFNAVTDTLGDLNVPIIMDVDLGHFPPSMPMVNGAKAKVEYRDNNVYIDYDFEK
ncbi:MAG: LD-carboxypeptidase [Bacilli bacterium]|nr:LD-carboxypeptidase [Bacilli bacterium]